jgi:SAM-dependent methyltransferase
VRVLDPGVAAFDALAGSYDAEFTTSALGRALRAAVWQHLDVRFAGRASLLELGCGTGEDAIHLAQRGYRVLATDASSQMIRIAQCKAEHAGVADRIRFLAMPMEQLGDVLGAERFDGVYSNFGAVNCVTDIPALARLLASHLKPRAPLTFVVMGRYVPWEWAWYLARGDRSRAWRRLGADGVGWRGMRIHYPTSSRLAAALMPSFDVTGRAGLGSVLPPSYAAAWLDRHPRWLGALSGIDRAISRFTANLADHYVLDASRGEPP